MKKLMAAWELPYRFRGHEPQALELVQSPLKDLRHSVFKGHNVKLAYDRGKTTIRG
jgi:hypothetical protein